MERPTQKQRDDANYYFQRFIRLPKGERDGNKRGVVTHYDGYMLLEVEEGNKQTDCWSAARCLAGCLKFDEVQENV